MPLPTFVLRIRLLCGQFLHVAPLKVLSQVVVFEVKLTFHIQNKSSAKTKKKIQKDSSQLNFLQIMGCICMEALFSPVNKKTKS